MTVDLNVDVSVGPVRGIPVLPTTVDVLLLNGPAVLHGWSLRDATGDAPFSAEGSFTAPPVFSFIATTPSVPAGTYNVNWTVELAGTPAAADGNNFELFTNTGAIVQSVNAGAVGVYPQAEAQATSTSSGGWAIKNIGVGTAGAVYTAILTLTPVNTPNTVIEIQDGNQPLGEVSLIPGGSQTNDLPSPGVQVRQQIKIHVISGLVTGVVYAQYDD